MTEANERPDLGPVLVRALQDTGPALEVLRDTLERARDVAEGADREFLDRADGRLSTLAHQLAGMLTGHPLQAPAAPAPVNPFITIARRHPEDGSVHFTIALEADTTPGGVGVVVADLVRHLAAALVRAGLANAETGKAVDAAAVEALVWEWIERERDNPTDTPVEVLPQ